MSERLLQFSEEFGMDSPASIIDASLTIPVTSSGVAMGERICSALSVVSEVVTPEVEPRRPAFRHAYMVQNMLNAACRNCMMKKMKIPKISRYGKMVPRNHWKPVGFSASVSSGTSAARMSAVISLSNPSG